MIFTRIALETHDTHVSTGVKFYWLASKNFTGWPVKRHFQGEYSDL
jgi:hypothetical protein